MATGGKGKEEENTLKAQVAAAEERANAAERTAGTPDPIEAERRAELMERSAWRRGERGSVDVRKMPGGAVGLSLRTEALKARDAGRIGKGYGSLAEGTNPAFSDALDKEMQLERDIQGAGMLEDYVTDTLAGDSAELGHWGDVGNQRNMTLAQLARQREQDARGNLQTYRSQKQPSIFKQLALGAIGGLSYSKGAFAI